MRPRHLISPWTGLLALLLALTARPAQAGCATPYAIRTRVEEAFGAYDVWDFDRFHEVLGEARARLACVEGVLGRDDVARYMMLEAAAAGLERDAGAAVAWFRGLRAADPDFTLTTELAPPGSLLRSAWEIAVASGEGPSLPLATDGWIVDGEIGAARLPTERAAVVQRTMPGLQTWVLRGGELPEDLRAQLGGEVAAREVGDAAPVAERGGGEVADARVPVSRAPELTGAARASPSRPAAATPRELARRRRDADTELGFDVGVPTVLRLGLHRESWNPDGGKGFDGFGLMVGAPVPPYVGIYADFGISKNWQIEVTGDLWSVGFTGGAGGGLAFQWDPPGRAIQAQVGAHGGGGYDCILFFGCTGFAYPAPDLRVGWTF